jgi:rhamnogalacturonyl hydrolase YesR
MNFIWSFFFLILPSLGFAQIDGHKILRHYERVHPLNRWEYDWTTAIFLYGALTYTQKNPDALWSSVKVQEKMNALLSRAPKITSPDLASMSLPASLVNEKKMIALSEEFFKTEPLNKIGALDHVGPRHRLIWFFPKTNLFVPSSIWADSMVMYVLNGYKLAKLNRDQKKEKFFEEQVYLFEKYLKDPKSGLYKHAYFVESKETYPSEFFWGRGNLWVSLGLIEILEHYPAERLKKMFVDHVKAIAKFADSERGLRTLLDDPNSHFETSATTLFAYVLKKGIRLKILEESYSGLAQDMVRAVEKNIVSVNDNELSVVNISGPTTAMKWPFYYQHVVGTRSDESYGVGAVLLLCSEL